MLKLKIESYQTCWGKETPAEELGSNEVKQQFLFESLKSEDCMHGVGRSQLTCELLSFLCFMLLFESVSLPHPLGLCSQWLISFFVNQVRLMVPPSLPFCELGKFSQPHKIPTSYP